MLKKQKLKGGRLLSEDDYKQAVHYYLDGGLKRGVAVSAFIRKAYYFPTKEEFRRYGRSKGYTSTRAEIRAIELALDDAINLGVDLKRVVLHTDQKTIAYGRHRQKPGGRYYDICKRLNDLGVSVRYDASIHNLDEFDEVDESEIPKKVLNQYLVHRLVNDNFKTLNRYQIHRLKQKQKKAA